MCAIEFTPSAQNAVINVLCMHPSIDKMAIEYQFGVTKLRLIYVSQCVSKCSSGCFESLRNLPIFLIDIQFLINKIFNFVFLFLLASVKYAHFFWHKFDK